MPPKLQVDESFAFLFTCIEASGCKIDFKLVGDATDLQPAAARMRYTRLRKAVESGHFKGATLTQPCVVSPRLSQLANPQSRRVGHNTQDDGVQQQIRASTTNATPNRELRKRPASFNDLSEGEEEHEEESLDELDEFDAIQEYDHDRKRRVSSTLVADESLFFPDTSQSFQTSKKIKRSASDIEARDDPVHVRNKFQRRSKNMTPQVGPDYPQASIRAFIGNDPQQSMTTTDNREQQLSTSPGTRLSSIIYAPEGLPHNHQSTMVSRKKQAANTAAEAAYTVGVRTGRFAPQLGDSNSNYIHSPSAHDRGTRLGYVGQSIHSLRAKVPAPGPNSDQPFQRPTSIARVSFPSQIQSPYTTTIPKMSNQYPIAPFQSPSWISPAPVTHPSDPNAHQETITTQSCPQMPLYDMSNPNRFHPASVFEGFKPPSPPSRSNSSKTTDPSASADWRQTQSTRPMSLLQKIRMERDKNVSKQMEKNESQAPLTSDNKLSGDPTATEATNTNDQSPKKVGANKNIPYGGSHLHRNPIHPKGQSWPSTTHNAHNRPQEGIRASTSTSTLEAVEMMEDKRAESTNDIRVTEPEREVDEIEHDETI